MKNTTLMFCLIVLLVVPFASAFYDHATNVYDGGSLVQNGNLRVEIFESASGGTAFYDQTFTSLINNGMWSVEVNAPLVYGKTYFKDYEINGQDIDFDGSERLAFISREGNINASNITMGNLDVARMPTGGTWSLSSIIDIVGSWLRIGGNDVLTNESNESMKSYVDANNVTLVSYVGVQNVIYNNSMKSYVDTQNSTMRSLLNLILSGLQLNITNNNNSMKSYVDVSNSSMKSYVDSLPDDDIPDSDAEVPDAITVSSSGSVDAAAIIGLVASAQGGVPPGSVIPFVNSSCPTGWELCDGSGTCPDLRGIFIRGAGTSGSRTDAAGNYYSAIEGTYQNDSFQGHKHFMRRPPWQSVERSAGSTYYAPTTTYAAYDEGEGDTSDGVQEPSILGSDGVPRTGSETRPANYAMIYCMKQ